MDNKMEKNMFNQKKSQIYYQKLAKAWINQQLQEILIEIVLKYQVKVHKNNQNHLDNLDNIIKEFQLIDSYITYIKSNKEIKIIATLVMLEIDME